MAYRTGEQPYGHDINRPEAVERRKEPFVPEPNRAVYPVDHVTSQQYALARFDAETRIMVGRQLPLRHGAGWRDQSPPMSTDSAQACKEARRTLCALGGRALVAAPRLAGVARPGLAAVRWFVIGQRAAAVVTVALPERHG
jgi:hypothetical protein